NGALDVNLPTRIAPFAGVVVMPADGVRIGVVYRSALDLSLRLGIIANVDVAGVVTGDTVIDIRAINFYTPRRLSLGGAVDVAGGPPPGGDLAWATWPAFPGAPPDVNPLVNRATPPPLLHTLFPADGFHDTFVPRLAAEWRPPSAWDITFRTG